MKRLSSSRGLSLVEATIILAVLGTLTSVLAPSVTDYVNDAKMTRVKEDCEAIGTGVARLMRDVGPCLRKNGLEPCRRANRVDLLVSAGPVVAPADLAATATPFGGGEIAASPYNWDANGATVDSMEGQFTVNSAAYQTPGQLGTYLATTPRSLLGWRGAYLPSPIGPDPWGRRYLVNSAFLTVATDATQAAVEGGRLGGWSYDTFCISSGPDALFQTPIASSNGGTLRQGDDFVYIISGGTR